ncbi:MAG: hypothetical protein HZRFUVUK_002100, partial [Candidatus Fervidibacterota bacterium]
KSTVNLVGMSPNLFKLLALATSLVSAFVFAKALG